jgi:hypothetical protein
VVAGLIVGDLHLHDDTISLKLGGGGHGNRVLHQFFIHGAGFGVTVDGQWVAFDAACVGRHIGHRIAI